jgi:zinc finger CCHC domain-containing protein 8
LDVINIHDNGQEKWREKYIHWIPALHLEGKEIVKGRWGADTVASALNRWEAMRKQEAAQKSAKE